jgi:hypothetical protein
MRTPTHRSRPQTRTHERPTPARVPQWCGQHRPEMLHAIAVRTRGLTWSQRLLDLLLEELHIGDDFDRLAGSTRRLHRTLYPQVIAIALLLRHSWCSQDLARTSKRLGLPLPAAATAASSPHIRTRSTAAVPAAVVAKTPRSSSRRLVRIKKERRR